MVRALILEDDACSALALTTLLEEMGLHVSSVDNSREAIEKVHDAVPDLPIADWHVFGDMPSLEIARQVRTKNPDAQVIFISGCPREDVAELTQSLGPCSIYEKPLSFEALANDIVGHAEQYGPRLSPEQTGARL
jgi:DNA-binding NtrC family response regulator